MDKPRRGDTRGRRGGHREGQPQLSIDERLSRFLAFVLRHHPEEIGLELDARGFADLDAIVQGVCARPGLEKVTRKSIERMVMEGDAALRFEIAGGRIRARYGHTLPQPIQYDVAEPPELLFQGTTPEETDRATKEGLKAKDRQRVHLSIDVPAAREVGQRQCPDPVVLQIDTVCAAKAGVQFYRAGPAVWLSDDLPPESVTRAP